MSLQHDEMVIVSYVATTNKHNYKLLAKKTISAVSENLLFESPDYKFSGLLRHKLHVFTV